MTPEQNQRAYWAQERAMAAAEMVREEDPNVVAAWLRTLSQRDLIDLVIVQAAAAPRTTKQFAQAWAWTDHLAPEYGQFEKKVADARAKGFRDVDIARALSCRVEELPPRIRVA